MADLGRSLMDLAEVYKRLSTTTHDCADIKRALIEEGLDGFLSTIRSWTKNPRSTSRIPPEIEQHILSYTMQFPSHGKNKVSSAMRQQGVSISPGSIRGIWLKHQLETKEQRRERWPQAEMTDAYGANSAAGNTQSLSRSDPMHPGQLLIQDSYFVGYVTGIGRIYQQSCVDMQTNRGFAKLYRARTALSAADLLNDQVLPYFDRLGMPVREVLTDFGTEFCGINESHPYELFLHINGIGHIRSRAAPAEASQKMESFNSFLQREFYDGALGRTGFASLASVQQALDQFLLNSPYKAPV